MVEFGFATSAGLERVEKELVEVEVGILVGTELPFLDHNSDEDGGRSVRRKEGTRKAERILQGPTLEPMRMEGVIRKAPWVLLDPAEELPELKPCHHSTPLMPTSSGISKHKVFGKEILDFSFQESASSFLPVSMCNVRIVSLSEELIGRKGGAIGLTRTRTRRGRGWSEASPGSRKC